jgi:hypothetical protein
VTHRRVLLRLLTHEFERPGAVHPRESLRSIHGRQSTRAESLDHVEASGAG